MAGTTLGSTARTRSGRSRMLAAAALAASAALVAGCASQGGPGSTTAPPAPTGAAPVALSAEQLQSPGLFDAVSAEGAVVRWLEPGASIAVVVGGSGGGGECIPQPHPATLEPGESGTEGEGRTIVVHFDPPSPDAVCTADFTLHGWELPLPESAEDGSAEDGAADAGPIDAEAVVPVRLVDLAEGETRELRIGPDDLLVQPTADPQPSVVPGTPPPGAPAPEEIPEAQLPTFDELAAQQPRFVRVRWVEPGASLAVFTVGSRAAPRCNAVPKAAWSTGPGTIEVAYGPNEHEGDCPADGGVWGWVFTLPEPVSATLPVEVTVTGASPLDPPATVTLQPDDVADLG